MIRNLTGLRAYAAFWVVLYHLKTAAGISETNLGPLVNNGQWGVDVFFVLSGYILTWVYAERVRGSGTSWLSDFLYRRLAKIYPLHIFTFVVSLLAWSVAKQLGFQFTGATENTPFTAVTNIFLVHAWGLSSELSWNTPSWSVSAEWFAYLFLFPLYILYILRWPLAVKALLVVVLWFGLCIIGLSSPQGHIAYTSAGVLRIIPEFLAGCLIYGFPKVRNGDLLVGLGVALLLLVCYQHSGFSILLLPAIMLVIQGLSAGGAVSDRIFGNRLVVMLGEVSFSIYMTHNFVLMASNQLVRRIGMTFDPLSLILMNLAVCAFVGWMSYQLIERPIHSWLLRWHKRRAVSDGT